MREDEVGKEIVDSAFKVHQALGPGLLEKAYEACLTYELELRGLNVERQKAVPITYGEVHLEVGFRLDLLIENSVIVELKATEKENSLWQAQILSYMRLSNRKIRISNKFQHSSV